MEAMLNYIGVKIVKAKIMTLGDYNIHKGWKIPDDEDPAKLGYLVEYSDDYQSWCPLAQFKAANRRCDAMTFGHAIEAMKQGKKVARAGWNGKGMWVRILFPGKVCYADTKVGIFETLSCIGMKTADGKMCPGWLASQTDMLAEDWQVIE